MRLPFTPAAVREDIDQILHLPFMERLLHPKSRRPLIAMAVGTALMLAASTISVEAEHISHYIPLPHNVIDAFAYWLHGMAALPFARYIEPLWWLFMGAASE